MFDAMNFPILSRAALAASRMPALEGNTCNMPSQTGVAPYDPATFGAVTLLMVAIGIAASWIPALRASQVDPVITMRAQ
jgi:ABC-type antimicrobial peptide transport system permease subunit